MKKANIMKKDLLRIVLIASLILVVSLAGCAPQYHPRNNAEAGAIIGAGVGALLGQAIGRDTGSTIVGLAAGTMIGALVGNAADQGYQAGMNAAHYGKPVIYYDEQGRAVEAIPEGNPRPNCRTIRKRVWDHGRLVQESVEEVCDMY